VATLSEAPGWRPDPQQPGSVRWWNGVDWSDARRSADQTMDRVRAAAQDAAHASTISAQQVARTTADSRTLREASAAAAGGAVGATNPIAVAALAVATVALGFGLYGLLPLLGFVLSIIGLVRGRRLERRGEQQTGFGQSLAGLLLSIIGLAQWLPFLVLLVPGLPGLLPTPQPS
jgi:Flp pilus assembly protein TadB